MKTYLKISVVVVLLAVVAAVVISKAQRKVPDAMPVAKAAEPPAPATAAAPLPRLVDLGAHSCIPCKKMAPILEELRNEYEGRLRVDFIDVWQNPDAGQQYGIKLIPTQIFYDATGKELARHEGFMAKEDILAQWSVLGVALSFPPGRQE